MLRAHHGRAGVLNGSHRGLFIHPPAVQANGVRFADRQVQRMNVPPAAVQQRAGIAFAVDFPADGAGVQQLQLRVAVAFPVGFLLLQRLQLLMV